MSSELNFVQVYLLSRAGIAFLQCVLWYGVPVPQRVSGAVAPLNSKDKAYIAINSVTETLFLQHCIAFIATLDSFSSVFTTALASCAGAVLLTLGDDFLYSAFHYSLHKAPFPLYKAVHYHHHGNTDPSRGYLDAVNEAPIEMGFALLITAFVMEALRRLLTPAAVILFVTMRAIFAIINHLGRDVVLFGGLYDSRRHTLHHKLKYVHYGQL